MSPYDMDAWIDGSHFALELASIRDVGVDEGRRSAIVVSGPDGSMALNVGASRFTTVFTCAQRPADARPSVGQFDTAASGPAVTRLDGRRFLSAGVHTLVIAPDAGGLDPTRAAVQKTAIDVRPRETLDMAARRSPFLVGALRWISGDGDVAGCDVCHFDWSMPSADCVEVIAASPGSYSSLLDGRDGMAPAADGGWNATSYVWHLTDLARSWSERWVQIRVEPGSLLAGWDPDVLAEARNYRGLPTVAALWALDRDVATFVELSRELDQATTFEHGDWGTGTVGDATRWLAHEFTHHQIDVVSRAT